MNSIEHMKLLEIYLTPLGQDPKRFHATTSQSSAGEGWADSDLPFWEGEKDWRSPIIKVLEGSGVFYPKHFPNPGEQEWLAEAGILNADCTHFHTAYLQQIGELLYQSLLPPDSSLRRKFQDALRFAESENTELHLRLKFSADSAVRSRLADYPWELLHDGQRFLQERNVRISRYIAYESLPPNLQLQDRVRVLLVSSRPHDPEGKLATLSGKEEMAIREGLKKAEAEGHIVLESLPQATFDALRIDLTQRTSEQMPQVLHFDGHGLFGKRCANPQCKRIHPGIKADQCRDCRQALPTEPTGFLIFEDSEGKPEYVSARSFAAALPNETTLVVLSACQSGMAVAGQSVFNGTAQQLIDARTPAVVAMQYAVRADAASRFAEQFYRVLGQKKPVIEAVNRGQQWMGFDGNQWYRPVLYLRWLDNQGGELFSIGESVTPTRTRLSRFQRLEMERLEIDLNDLERDYESVKKQLWVELDAPTQNRLERRIEQIGEQMDLKEQQLARLKQQDE